MLKNKTTKKIKAHPAIEALGWYGVMATIVAYLLVSFSILSPINIWYQLLNLTGALGVTIETYYKKDYQPFWLNLIWMLIALSALISIVIHVRA
jgi:hypothetical protein